MSGATRWATSRPAAWTAVDGARASCVRAAAARVIASRRSACRAQHAAGPPGASRLVWPTGVAGDRQPPATAGAPRGRAWRRSAARTPSSAAPAATSRRAAWAAAVGVRPRPATVVALVGLVWRRAARPAATDAPETTGNSATSRDAVGAWRKLALVGARVESVRLRPAPRGRIAVREGFASSVTATAAAGRR